MNRRRLDLEAFRDSLLAAAGRLDLTMGGPSVQLTEAPFPRGGPCTASSSGRTCRRSSARSISPIPTRTRASRPQTASPQQALFLLNSPFVLEQARALAERTAGDGDELQRLERLYRFALGRSPTLEEAADVHEFLAADWTTRAERRSLGGTGAGAADVERVHVCRT